MPQWSATVGVFILSLICGFCGGYLANYIRVKVALAVFEVRIVALEKEAGTARVDRDVLLRIVNEVREMVARIEGRLGRG